MVEVEKQLIESKEIPASLHASILNYEMNTEEASEMLGVNEEQSDFINQEKNMVDEDRKEESDDSIEVQDEIITFKNSTNMNITIFKCCGKVGIESLNTFSNTCYDFMCILCKGTRTLC